MAPSPVDYTARIPTETLHEIIECIDDRKDLHGVVHVCSRWRQVAFAHPRRHCWFRCDFQYIRHMDKAQNELCYAQLRCRAQHKKWVDVHLSETDPEQADIVLRLLDQNMGRFANLAVGWSGPALGHRILDLLTRRPAPLLIWLQLSDSSHYRADAEDCPRIPSTIFAGEAPALTNVMITSVRLPQAPLKQFSAVTTVSILRGCTDSTLSPTMPQLMAHFPAMTSMTLGPGNAILLNPRTTPQITAGLTQLQYLMACEAQLNLLSDAWPQLGALPHISVFQRLGGPSVSEERTVARLLAHFKNMDVDLKVNFWPNGLFYLQLKAHPAGSTVVSTRSFDVLPALLARTPLKTLRTTRAQIDDLAFSTVWPLLPPGTLLRLRVLVSDGAALQDANFSFAPRKMAALRELVFSHRYGGAHGHRVSISGSSLATFLRAAIIMTPKAAARPTLRLENVDVDGWKRGTKRVFQEVVIDAPHPLWWL